MGNRTFLFVHDQQQAELEYAQCVAETNNRFALEWWAWVPQEVLDEYVATVRRLEPRIEAGGAEDEGAGGECELATIRVPYAQAMACFRQSLFRILRAHPALAPALRDLFIAVDSHAQRYAHPVLTLDCIQMANFSSVDGYLHEVQILHAFWQQRTPWEQVSFAAELSHPQGASSCVAHDASRVQRMRLEQELSALAQPPGHAAQRWRDRHEDAITWVLAIVAATACMVVYLKSSSWLLGGLTFLGTAVGLALLVFHQPRVKPFELEPLKQKQMEVLKQKIQALRAADAPPGDSFFDVDPCWQTMPWLPQENAMPAWDTETVTVRSWSTGQRIRYRWADIERIGYDADDGVADAALVGSIELTEVAEQSGRYAHLEQPLWFDFAQGMDAHLSVLVLRLLHRIKTASV